MITIANLSDLNEALVLKSFLEAEGIAAFLPDEYSLQNDGFGSFAFGGIRIQVPEADHERALALVAEFKKDE